jgi:ATP-binding cassette subfamily F protein 3
VQVTRLSKRYGDRPILDDVSFRVGSGERLAVVGRNGEGKTTLLRALSGEIGLDGGSVSLAKGERVAIHDQRPPRSGGESVREYVLAGAPHALAAEEALARLQARMADGDTSEGVMGAYERATAELERAGGWDWRVSAERTMRGLGIVEGHWDQQLDSLSGGELTRVSLARALASNPDVLLLDEPTNHLDIESAEWLEAALTSMASAIVVVSHDRWFLESVATAVLELRSGRARLWPMRYSKFRAERLLAAEREAAAGARQAAEIARLERFVERWRSGTKARQAQSRAKRLARMAPVETSRRERAVAFGFPKAARAPKIVISAEELRISAGDRELLSGDVVIERGERVALLGPNGAGKTTLLETLLGMRTPAAGRVRIGHGVERAYFSQHADELDDDRTVVEEMLSRSTLNRTQARTLLGGFLFSGDAADAPVSRLSGGERRRLALACLVAGGGNLLALDEPTNHFDAESREALEDAIAAYDGTVILISHDRALIDAVATRTVAIEDGALVSRPGGYAELVASRKAAERPSPSVAERNGSTRRPKPRPGARRSQGTRARREAKKLEDRIAKLEGELAAIESELAQPDVTADSDLVAEKGARHRDVEQEIAWLMHEWERVSESASP